MCWLMLCHMLFSNMVVGSQRTFQTLCLDLYGWGCYVPAAVKCLLGIPPPWSSFSPSPVYHFFLLDPDDLIGAQPVQPDPAADWLPWTRKLA